MIIKYRTTFFHDACCTDNLEWGEQMIYISALGCVNVPKVLGCMLPHAQRLPLVINDSPK